MIWLSSAIPEQCSPRLAKADECDYSGQNYTKIKDPQVDELLNAADKEADPAARAALYNQADLQLAHQRRHRRSRCSRSRPSSGTATPSRACSDNPTQDGFTWNIEDWTYSRLAPAAASVDAIAAVARDRSARNVAVIAFVVRRLLTAVVGRPARDDRGVRARLGAR